MKKSSIRILALTVLAAVLGGCVTTPGIHKRNASDNKSILQEKLSIALEAAAQQLDMGQKGAALGKVLIIVDEPIRGGSNVSVQLCADGTNNAVASPVIKAVLTRILLKKGITVVEGKDADTVLTVVPKVYSQEEWRHFYLVAWDRTAQWVVSLEARVTKQSTGEVVGVMTGRGETAVEERYIIGMGPFRNER